MCLHSVHTALMASKVAAFKGSLYNLFLVCMVSCSCCLEALLILIYLQMVRCFRGLPWVRMQSEKVKF